MISIYNGVEKRNYCVVCVCVRVRFFLIGSLLVNMRLLNHIVHQFPRSFFYLWFVVIQVLQSSILQ